VGGRRAVRLPAVVVVPSAARGTPRVVDRCLALADGPSRGRDSRVEPLATGIGVPDTPVAVRVPDDLLHPEIGELVLDMDPGIAIRRADPALDDLVERRGWGVRAFRAFGACRSPSLFGAFRARLLQGVPGRIGELAVARRERTDDDRPLILARRHDPRSVRRVGAKRQQISRSGGEKVVAGPVVVPVPRASGDASLGRREGFVG